MVKKRNHKVFNLIVMICISICLISILNVSYAQEKIIDNNSSFMIADVIYGEKEEITTDYVPDEKDDKSIDENAKGKLFLRENKNDLFKSVRKNVAQWYYIFRYIGMAVMLVILIGISIKLALSSIAEQKAVYKRMLLDWVVCFVLLFMAHYFMIFIQVLNERLVDIFQKVSNSITSDGEYSLYETVRSRAYDVKFTVGFSGMFLYMILVYFTFKYAYIYAKRFITMVILTVMAPIIVLFYGIQKIFTGRSKTFAKWMEEYATNTLLQAVHALTYATFVGLALKLSQESLAGMILAFIFLNFMTKADSLFRNIFKFSDGSSLAEEIAQSKLSEIKDTASTLAGAAVAADSLRKARKNNPNTLLEDFKQLKFNNKILKSTQAVLNTPDKLKNLAKDGVLLGASKIRNNKNVQMLGTYLGIKSDERFQNKNEKFDKNIAALQSKMEDTKRLYNARKSTLTDEQKDQFKKKMLELYNEKNREERRKQNYNVRQGAFARARELLDPDTYLEYEIDEETGDFKTNRKGTKRKRRAVRAQKLYNAETDSYEIKGGLKDKFKKTKDDILGLSDEDKALIKEMKQMAKDGLLGGGAMLLGMGSFVDNPSMGFALLASGFGKLRKLNKVDDEGLKISRGYKRKIRKIQRQQSKKYIEPQFTTGTILNMDSIIKELTVTDPSVSRINHLINLVQGGGLKYAIPLMPFTLTGTKGSIINVLKQSRKMAEQHVKNIKKYEITVNVELSKILKKEIIEECQTVCENVATHIMYQNVERLMMERRMKNKTLFVSSEGVLFGFNTKENCDILSPESRIKQAIIDTALSRHIYDFKRFDINDKYTREKLLENLKAQGKITGMDISSNYQIKKLLDGDTSDVRTVLENMSQNSPDLLKTKLYEQTVIEYAQTHDIKSVSDFTSTAVHNAINNSYRNKLYFDHTDADMKAVILSTSLANNQSITSLSVADIINMSHSENPSALEALEKSLEARANGQTIEEAIEAKQKQINGLLNDMVIGAMINHGITNTAGLDLTSTNDPEIQSLKADLINLFNFAYKDSDSMSISNEDLMKIMQSQIDSVTKEDIERTVINDVYTSFVSDVCDGDVSKLSDPNVKDMLTEQIVEKLSSLAETDEEKNDISNIVEVLNSGKKKEQDDVEKSVKDKNSMFTIGNNDSNGDGDSEEAVGNFPLPVVTTKIVDDKVYCTFEVPAGSDGFKIETCKKSDGNSKENYAENIETVVIEENEIACARLIKDGKHGQSLVIRYPVDAIKIVKKMESAEKREARTRDEEKSNNVDKIGMKVLDSIKEFDKNSSAEEILGEEQIDILDNNNSEDSSVEVAFKEFEIRSATNNVLDVAETIRKKKVRMNQDADNSTVLGMIDNALEEVDELRGLNFDADMINESSAEAYENYKQSTDNLIKKLLQIKMIDDDNDKLEIKSVPEKNKAFKKVKQELQDGISNIDVNEIIGSIHQRKGV